MTKEEAEKSKSKYEFLIGHSFVMDEMEVVVKELHIRKNEPNVFEVMVEYTDGSGNCSETILSAFISTIGVAFWIKYFSTLRARV